MELAKVASSPLLIKENAEFLRLSDTHSYFWPLLMAIGHSPSRYSIPLKSTKLAQVRASHKRSGE